MSLKPNESLTLAAATGAVVYGTYNLMLPTVADTRALPGNTPDIDSSEKVATWTCVGVVAGISLLAKSPEVFVVGGLMTIALAWTYKHASKVDNFQSQARALITPSTSETPSGVSTAPAQSSQSLSVGAGSAF